MCPVTLPHPRQSHSTCGCALRPPEAFSKEQILGCLHGACAAPVRGREGPAHNGFAGASSVMLNRVGVFRELHEANEEGEVHAHYGRQFASQLTREPRVHKQPLRGTARLA